MNRSFSALLAVALLLIAPLLMWTWLHNSLVGKEEKVFESWAQTESNFQRRADLVPALVDTVSRYLKHESETLIGIAEKRSEAATRVSELVDELIRTEKESADILREEGRTIVEDEQRLKRLFETQAALQRGMNNLFAVVEAYPELRSSDQFLELQAQLEGTENRINVARLRFNDAVLDYNGTMRMLPWSLVANLAPVRIEAWPLARRRPRSSSWDCGFPWRDSHRRWSRTTPRSWTKGSETSWPNTMTTCLWIMTSTIASSRWRRPVTSTDTPSNDSRSWPQQAGARRGAGCSWSSTQRRTWFGSK
jgi:LemA protein